MASAFTVLLGQPGGTHTTEARYRHRNGGWRFLQSSCRNLCSTSLEGILVNSRDITERRLAEDALAQSEERFRQMAEHTRDVFFLYDTEANRQLYISPAYATIWGRSLENLFTEPMAWLDGVHPGDRDRVIECMQKRTPSVEFRITRPDGDVRWIHTRISELPAHRIVGVAQDITERKNAQLLALAHAEALQQGLIQAIEAIAAALEAKDPYTSGHQHRVAMLAAAIGEELGLGDERLKGLTLASELHDIGKIGVPLEVLCRPGKLTPAEFALIKAHSQIGYDILKGIQFPWPIGQVVVQHHERLDGSGYPNGLKGDQIILEARIVAVADVFESMTAHRPYRPALGIETAMAELQRGRGTAFDPAVVDACLRVIEAGRFTAGAGGRNLSRLLARENRAAELPLPLPLAIAK